MTARGVSLGLTGALALGGWLVLAQSRPEPSPTPGRPVEWKKGSSVKFEKPSDEELKQKLTRLQYEVTQHEATEPPFSNQLNDNHEEGLYVDVVSGEPLFSSKDKYDSGSGWPAFTRPVDEEHVATRTDFKLVLPRSEVRSKLADSHLGHVFPDGPGPTGQRYCVNSAAMRFVPVSRLEAEGYGEYLKLFGKKPAASPEKSSKK